MGYEKVTIQDIYTHYGDLLKSHPHAAPSRGLLDMEVQLGTGSGGALQVWVCEISPSSCENKMLTLERIMFERRRSSNTRDGEAVELA